MAVAGLSGLPGALFSMLAGSILALLWLLFDAWKRGRMRRKFAFGPFLAAGAVLWLPLEGFLFDFLLKHCESFDISGFSCTLSELPFLMSGSRKTRKQS